MLKDISFTAVSGKNKELFAFIQKDDALGLINCHIFQYVCWLSVFTDVLFYIALSIPDIIYIAL